MLDVGSNAKTYLTLKYKLKILSSLLSILVLFHSCVISKKSTDKSITKYLKKNPDIVRESATFSVSAAIDQNIREFTIKNITDKKMKNKISNLGTMVYISFSEVSHSNEIPDSNVTFKNITLFGVTEVIYDFATRERQFQNNISNRTQYYFVKVADRIYYRRRQIPMM